MQTSQIVSVEKHKRRRHRNNYMVCREALTRNKRTFKGICLVHGETTFNIYNGDARLNYRCRKCVLLQEAKTQEKKTPDIGDYRRKLWNKPRLIAANRQNLNQVELLCKYHNLTLFSIDKWGRAICIECRREKARRAYKPK